MILYSFYYYIECMKSIKITLINPPQKTDFPQPPLGLAYVATALEKAGYEVEIIDAPALKLTTKETIRKVVDNGVDFVGITAMTPTICSAIEIARGIKENDNSKFVFMGGAHVTALPKKTLEDFPEIDVIVIGEGEVTTPILIKRVKNKKNLRNVLGIAYREDRKIIVNRLRPIIKNLDGLPIPAYHLLPINKYRPYPPHGKKLPYMAIMTSRGCPFRCAFCSKSVHGKIYRAKSPKAIIEEIKYIKKRYRIKELLFYDDTFTLNRQRIIELCNEMIKNKINIPWSCETRVNLVDKELLSKMKRAGCYIISYGVESGNQKILNNIKKDITIEQIKNAFKITRDVGINIVSYFMLGCPGDTEKTIKQTIEFAKELDANFTQFSICTPFPGTEISNIINQNMIDWNKFTYVSNRSEMIPVVLSKHLTRRQLKKWYNKAYKEFYLRPTYLLKIILRTRSIDDIKVNINGIKMFLNILR
jgi:anaerobic magnesium-protoporphyrin IX monomethyl ester cyclase